jgi:hypothetical protein
MTHAAGGTGARPKGSHAWLQGLACGALLAFAPSFALLLAVLLAPAIAASLLDRRPHHPVARAVALASGAFTLGPVWRLATGGHPLVIGLAWLAGACGWALCVLLPVVLRAASDVRAAARIAALQAEAEALRAAWDLDRPA